MNFYFLCFVFSLLISLVLTPVIRKLAVKFNVMDVPHSSIKTHKEPIPYLGGVAICIGFWVSILIIRLITKFPTGTLFSLRGILFGSMVIAILGLIDDIKFKGLHFSTKFIIQIFASGILVFYGIKMDFITPEWFALLVSIVWVVGVTNALNIIDIMDGLSSGIAVIAALGFFFIGLPQEEEIYVNFASIALAGAILGFIPYNLSKKYRIFMGDTGALFIGFILSSVALGTRYTDRNNLGLLAPVLILAVPVYDTLLVSYFRWKKGQSPFLGSKDHFALRLKVHGFTRNKILGMTYLVAIALSLCALMATRVTELYLAAIIYLVVIIAGIVLAYQLSKIKIDV